MTDGEEEVPVAIERFEDVKIKKLINGFIRYLKQSPKTDQRPRTND
ncbi:MAG: hypothetical protein AB1566_14195 [Chloroflexota bacterium]